MLSNFPISDEGTDTGQHSLPAKLVAISRSNLSICLADIQQSWYLSKTEQACANYRSVKTGQWETEYFKTGDVSSVTIDLKAIIMRIVKGDSDAIILCHCHPEGPTQPSEIDLRTTRKVAQICNTLNVELVDHIIFGKGPYFSFRRANYL